MTVQSTPEALRIQMRLGYATVEPTMMSTLVFWMVCVFAGLMGFGAAETRIPSRTDLITYSVMGCLGLLFPVATVFDRARIWR